MLFSPHQTLLFVGASITDCGRARTDDAEPNAALGNGYVSLVDSLIANAYPAHHLRVLNRGVSGNTTRDLIVRWQTDVLDETPDWAALLLPTNDVWRHFDRSDEAIPPVYEAEYEANLHYMAQTRPAFPGGLIFMAPFVLEPNPTDPMRAMMDKYGGIAKRVAEANSVLFVDTQAAFAPLLAHYASQKLAPDRVHPHQSGHVTLARAFLQAVQFEWIPE